VLRWVHALSGKWTIKNHQSYNNHQTREEKMAEKRKNTRGFTTPVNILWEKVLMGLDLALIEE
jgi:hypothetical protein